MVFKGFRLSMSSMQNNKVQLASSILTGLFGFLPSKPFCLRFKKGLHVFIMLNRLLRTHIKNPFTLRAVPVLVLIVDMLHTRRFVCPCNLCSHHCAWLLKRRGVATSGGHCSHVYQPPRDVVMPPPRRSRNALASSRLQSGAATPAPRYYGGLCTRRMFQIDGCPSRR